MERENLWLGANMDRNCGIELEKLMILIFKFCILIEIGIQELCLKTQRRSYMKQL